jgi:hypothetical protein
VARTALAEAVSAGAAMVNGDQPTYGDLAHLLAAAMSPRAFQEEMTYQWSFSASEPDLPLPTHMTLSFDLANHILIHTEWETTEGLMRAILARLALAGFIRATADD